MLAKTTMATALVIDPDPQSQQIVGESLRGHYQIVAVSTMGEALSRLGSDRPTIIIMELDLPDGDGISLIKQLRANPATKSIIIACLTRRSSIKDKVAGFQAGADDYSVKPINPSSYPFRLRLLQRVRQLSTY